MKIDLKLIKEIHSLILTDATGSPELLAQKLGISRRSLYTYLKYMRVELEAPIIYSRPRETFYYKEEWELYIGSLTKVKVELLKELMDTIQNF